MKNPSELKSFLQALSEKECNALQYEWDFWARPKQVPPRDNSWSIFLYLAGRGSGKTRAGAEWVRWMMTGRTPLSPGPTRCRHLALVGETAADVRDVMLGEGRDADQASGIFQVHPKEFRPEYQVTKRRLVWPNGAIATLYNASEPDQLRGPQHGAAWCDELAKWQYASETWDNLEFGLRLGDNPQTFISTTPKPIPLLRDLLADDRVLVRHGSTYENIANLSDRFIARMRKQYEGTRLGRQELYAELLDDVPNALWTSDMIEKAFVQKQRKAHDLSRVVIGVDPSGASGDPEESANEIGIVVCGKGSSGDLGFVLADRSGQYSPEEWAEKTVTAYYEFGADLIVAERNFGGAMVESIIRGIDRNAPVKLVTASRGKSVRAEPVAMLYEKERIKHIGGFPQLEDQMRHMSRDGTYGGRGSPDRLDAMVWALHELFLQEGYYYDTNLENWV